MPNAEGSPIDSGAAADLTARFNALREVLQNEIRASSDSATARMDGLDAERGILLDGLHGDRDGIRREIQSVRDLQDALHAALASQAQLQATELEATVRLRAQALADKTDSLATALQLQIDQRFGNCDSKYLLMQEEIDRRVAALMALLDERYAAQIRSFEEQRDSALGSVQAALASAREAVSKAETATEKRFECVSSDVKILCADLIWRPAADLLPGDELIAFDEAAPTRRGRRFRRSTVTANSLARDVMMRVVTPAGQVRCNPQHPWLARRDSTCKYGRSNWQWIKTEDLRPGDSVLHSLDTWITDRSWEAGWLAGMYDGEGCLSLSKQNLQLTLSQRESPTSDLIASVLKERLGKEPLTYRIEPGTPSTPRNTVPFFHLMVSHRPDVMKILGSVRPPRLMVRADDVWEGQVIASHNRAVTVTAVEPDGTGMISRLSTSTHTYIGEGFAMHNSVNEFRQTLTDQAAQFPTRLEIGTQITALQSTGTRNADNIKELELRVTSRLDTMAGQAGGAAEFRSERRLDTAQVVSIIVGVLIFLGLIVSAATLVHK